MDGTYYDYSYCKLDTAYYTTFVLDGSQKNRWTGADYSIKDTTTYPLAKIYDGTNTGGHLFEPECSLYEYKSKNYPLCKANAPGFISPDNITPANIRHSNSEIVVNAGTDDSLLQVFTVVQ